MFRQTPSYQLALALLDAGVRVAVRGEGFANASGSAQLLCRFASDDDGASGRDPTAAATPDTSLGLEDRKVGGLGIYLVREMMDRVDYQRRGERNHLEFSKAFAAPSAS